MASDDELRVLLPPSVGHIKAGARAEVLEHELTRQLGGSVRVSVASDYDHLAAQTLSDHADLVWAPPRLFAEVAPRALHAMRAVRGDDATQRAAILVRASSPYRDVGGLRGLRAAWVDKESTSGYVMPRAHLRDRGLDPLELFADERFFGSFRDALMAVIQGEADVCSIFCHGDTEDAVTEPLTEIIGGLADRLRPIAFSAPTPADGLVITRRMDPRRAAELAALIVSARCPALLPETCSASRFVAFYPEDDAS